MPSNTPAGNIDNLSAGNGIVYLGDAATTPATDAGFLGDEGITITYETETLDATAGFPATSIRQFVSAVTAGFSFLSQEWNLEQFGSALTGVFSTALGGGGETIETLGVGVDPCPGEQTARVVFCMPCVLHTIEINLWRIQSDGAFEITLDPAGLHNFAYNFRILQAVEKWDATPLTADVSLFEINREIPP